MKNPRAFKLKPYVWRQASNREYRSKIIGNNGEDIFISTEGYKNKSEAYKILEMLESPTMAPIQYLGLI